VTSQAVDLPNSSVDSINLIRTVVISVRFVSTPWKIIINCSAAAAAGASLGFRRPFRAIKRFGSSAAFPGAFTRSADAEAARAEPLCVPDAALSRNLLTFAISPCQSEMLSFTAAKLCPVCQGQADELVWTQQSSSKAGQQWQKYTCRLGWIVKTMIAPTVAKERADARVGS